MLLQRPSPGAWRNPHSHPPRQHGADAENWLKAHPHRGTRLVPTDAPEPHSVTYLQDPDHGWLIVTEADLVAAGMSSATQAQAMAVGRRRIELCMRIAEMEGGQADRCDGSGVMKRPRVGGLRCFAGACDRISTAE